MHRRGAVPAVEFEHLAIADIRQHIAVGYDERAIGPRAREEFDAAATVRAGDL